MKLILSEPVKEGERVRVLIRASVRLCVQLEYERKPV